MSLSEIAHRVAEQYRRNKYARSKVRLPDEKEGIFPVPIPGLIEAINDLGGDGTQLSSFKSVAEASKENTHHFLGQSWPGKNTKNKWHQDPVTEAHWPSDIYCFSIDWRETKGLGDIKYVYEINRLCHLQAVAVYAKASGGQEWEEFCVREIESWIDSNPAYLGVNWLSGIELSLRLVSLFFVCSTLGEGAFSPSQKKKLTQCMADHGFWLSQFPSKYSSANNHAVAEAGGLFILGTLFPDLVEAQNYREQGKVLLLQEVHRQIHSDGVGAEQTPTYQAFSMEWFMLCGMLAERLGDAFPAEYWDKLKKGGAFLRCLMDEQNNVPRIGDDDEGRVLFTSGKTKQYVSEVLNGLSSLCGLPELAPAGPIAPNIGQLIYGLSAPSEVGPSGMTTFKEGGYTINRWQTSKGEALLVFDHGPLGYLSIAAHGHADTHSIWLHLNGQPVLVDAGTFHYHAGGVVRDYFRGTAAHNTLSLGKTNSSTITGPFNWGQRAKTFNLNVDSVSDQKFVESSHDGYLRQFGVRHCRKVVWEDSGKIIIEDRLEGLHGQFPITISFLIHPKLEAVLANGLVYISKGDEVLLKLKVPSHLVCTLVQGETAEGRAFYSPSFGKKVPCWQVILSCNVSTDEKIETELFV